RTVSVKKRIFIGLGKYLFGFGVLGIVLALYWNPSWDKPSLRILGASTVGLSGSTQAYGPLLAASALYPGRGQEPGIKDVLSRPPHVAPLIAAAGFFSIGLLGTFWRWYVLVRAQDLPFRLSDAFRLGFIGYFFNTFLPGSIGGDFVKAACIAREQSRRTV